MEEHKCGYSCHHISHCSGFHIEELKKLDLYELGEKKPYFKFIDFPLDLDETFNESITYFGSPNIWQTPSVPESYIKSIKQGMEIKCDCPTRTLFEEGCKCGGI